MPWAVSFFMVCFGLGSLSVMAGLVYAAIRR